ncbi:MAG: NAD(P)-dependent oxidoreductase [Candidatus Fermentibacteraceae bacterium]
MNILVTGAAGFLGGAVLRKAAPEIDVTTLDRTPLPGRHILCDVTDEKALLKALSGLHFDAVIHLAGLPLASPDELIRVNVQGTANLVGAVDTGRFVLASSCAVYGAPRTPDGTVDEEHPTSPVSAYGSSMLSRERELYGGVALRLFNVTGPGQPTGMLVPDLARKLAGIALGFEPGPLITGPLHTGRDYLDVGDAARAFLAAALAHDPPPVINVGSGVCHTGARVLGILARAMGISPEVITRDGPAGVPWIRADTGRARAHLGFSPEVPLEESLAATARYWLEKIGAERSVAGFSSPG